MDMLPRERWWLSLCPPVAGWKPEIPSWTDIILYFFIGRTKKVIHLTNGLHCHGNVRCGEGERARVWERGRVVLQANLLTLQQRSVVEIWVRSSRPARQSKVSLKVSFFKIFYFFFKLYVYAEAVCAHMNAGPRKGHHISWSWGYRQLWVVWHGYYEPN